MNAICECKVVESESGTTQEDDRFVLNAAISSPRASLLSDYIQEESLRITLKK